MKTSDSWLQKNGWNRAGFTLMESAVSLAANSFLLLLVCGLLQAARSQEQQLRLEKNVEWHLFLNQVEEDVKDKQLIYCKEKELQFQSTSDDSLINYVVKNAEIIRLVYQKGHVPLLTGLRHIRYTKVGAGIHILVRFADEQEFQGYISVP